MAQQHYTETELKEIGEQCGNRLPPASAVQAMFLYEMQRETELERLFQGEMFRLARAKESQEGRMSELFEQIKALREEVAAKDVEKRLSMYKIRMDALQLSLSDKSQEMKSQSEHLVSLEEKVNDMKSTRDQPPTPDIAGLAKKLADYAANFEDVKSELNALNDDVTLLFEERNAVAQLLDEAKARTDEVEKQARSEMMEFKSEVHGLISKNEKEADERGKKAEERASDRISEMRQAIRAEAEKAKEQSHDHVAKVEQRVVSFIQRSNQRNVEIDQKTKEQISTAEQKVYSRILEVKQQVNMGMEHVEQQANLLADKAEQQCKEQIAMADQKSNLLIGEVGKYKWLAELEKEKIDLISDSVNVMDERITKTDDSVWELTTIFRAREKEQNDRIAKLEDLVRALTGQTPNGSPPASQLLHVQAANGQSLELSVPKGKALVASKKENIRSFTPGKQWMT